MPCIIGVQVAHFVESDLFPWHEALCTAVFADDLSWAESLRAWTALDTLHDEAVTQLVRHSGLPLHQLLHLAPSTARQLRVARACTQTVDNKLECTFTSQCAQHWRTLACLCELQSVVLAKGCRVFSEDHLLGRSLTSLPALRKLALPGVVVDDLAGVGAVWLLPLLSQLESLDLTAAKVEESAVTALGEGIAALQKLTHLNISRSSMACSAPAMARLAPHLPQLSALRELHLYSFHGCGTDGLAALAPVLAALPCLDTLVMGRQQVSDAGAGGLGRALAGRSSLTALSFGFANYHCVREQGAASLASCFKSHPRLARLRTTGVLHRHSFDRWLNAVCSLPHLRELAFECEHKQAADAFAAHQSALRSLTRLELHAECFEREHIDVLGPAIGRCTQLKDLRVHGHVVGVVADQLWLCPHLAPIAANLTHLALEGENEASLLAFLPTLTALQHLLLRGVAPARASSSGTWRAVGTALAALPAPGLTALSLERTLQPGEGADVAAGLSLLTGLRDLSFFENEWEFSDVCATAPALRGMAALTRLQFSVLDDRHPAQAPPNSGADAAVAALATHVAALSRLREVDISGYRVLPDSAAGKALLRALRRCPGVRVLFSESWERCT